MIFNESILDMPKTLMFRHFSLRADRTLNVATCPHLPGKSNATKVVKKGQKNASYSFSNAAAAGKIAASRRLKNVLTSTHWRFVIPPKTRS